VINSMESMEKRLETEMHDTIPLVRALGLKVAQSKDGSVVFNAALTPNINDKGCAFGGSLASLLTLSCWSVLRAHTWAQQIPSDIFVHTSRIVYIAPIWADFTVHASLSSQALRLFTETLTAKGKAAAIIRAEVRAADGVAATIEARFVAKTLDSADRQ